MRFPVLFIAIGVLLTNFSNDKHVVVGLQPFENFNPVLSDTIATALQKTYDFNTVVLKSIPIPSEAFVNTKTPRYRADFLIKFLQDHKADSIDYILGLTHQDISITKKDKQGNVKSPKEKYSDWGVMGLGYTPGSSCILSTYRLTHDNQEIYMDRMQKISIHELGHNLGLNIVSHRIVLCRMLLRQSKPLIG